MDLVTLVTACSLTVDAKITHALIWHQSGGEPWSFTVQGERQPQIYRSVGDAIGAAHAANPDAVAIRVGLTGLPATSRSVTVAMFAPCPNISIAARQITQLAEQCRVSPNFDGDPIYCAVAVYRGSWERPDNTFADAVRTSVANNDAPDFEMPAKTRIDAVDTASAPQPLFHDIATARPPASDDRERAWWSALFPVRSRPFDGSPINDSANDRPAADAQKVDVPSARPTPIPLHAGGLFVPRSAQRTPP
jgi:hypothetical protein